jgi:hypothetical protein
MNIKTTIALILLAGGCVALFYKGPELAPKLGLAPKPVEYPNVGTAKAIAGINVDNITRVEISIGGVKQLELVASAPGRELELPDQWPIRKAERSDLKLTLRNLKSRFEPVALKEDPAARQAELTDYGLDPSQKPVMVELETRENAQDEPRKFRITFGEPKRSENRFTGITYLRFADWAKNAEGNWAWTEKSEVLKLGPDVVRVLRRPTEAYRLRQLFPDVARLKVAESLGRGDDNPESQEAVIAHRKNARTTIAVTGPAGPYTLAEVAPLATPKPPRNKAGANPIITTLQLAQSWRLEEPVRDRVDPKKLLAALGAVPDLWVDRFYAGAIDAESTGFDPNSQPAPLTLTLTFSDEPKAPRKLIIGKVSRKTVEEREEFAPSPVPGVPPQMSTKRIITEYRYAKLDKTPLIFDIRVDKLNDLFFLKSDVQPPPGEPIPPAPKVAVAVDELRDSNLVPIDSSMVQDLTTVRDSHPVVELHKTFGKPSAARDEDKKDRWNLVVPYAAQADGDKVRDKLLDPLGTRAGKSTIYDRLPLQAVIGGLVVADRDALGLNPKKASRIEIVSDEWIGLPKQTLLVGKLDAGQKKCWVQHEGEDRINLVDDTVLKAANRSGIDFRSSKLFDADDTRLSEVIVQIGNSETVILHEILAANVTNWELLSPVKTLADRGKVDKFVSDLAQLRASDFVEEMKAPETLAALRAGLGGIAASGISGPETFGFDKPSFTITLIFTPNSTDRGLAHQVIEVGKIRDGKQEYFAHFKGDKTVFTIAASIPDQVKLGSVAFLPLQLWEGSDADIQRIEIKRGVEPPYTITRLPKDWEISQPFKATLGAGQIAPLAGSLANVKAERFEANSAQDLKRYGLEMPQLTIKFAMNQKVPATDTAPAREELQEHTLLIGNPTIGPNAGHFAKLADKPAIFVVGELLFADANKSAYDLLDHSLLTLSPASISEIQSTGADGSIKLTKTGTTWTPEGANFSVDKPTIDNITRVLSNLSAVKFVGYGAMVKWSDYGLEEASKPATLLVKEDKKDAVAHKIEIGKLVNELQPGGDRYARVDGGMAVAVLAAQTASALTKSKLALVDRGLLKFNPVEVQAIRRAMDKSELELTQNATNGNWEISKPAMLKADQITMEELVDQLANLRADSIKAIDAKNLADFGLDPTAATIKIELLDNRGKTKERILRIGKPVDPTKPAGLRFAMTDGSSVIAELNGDISKRLLADPTKFRDRSLASFVSADKMSIVKGDRKVTFAKSAGSWKMTEPLDAPAEDEALRELHDRIAQFRADELVTDKPADLKTYGLDKPIRWQFFNGDKEVLNLLVGKKEGDRAYAKLDKGDLVVLLTPDLTKRLTAEYRKRALWETLDVAQAGQIGLKTSSDTGSFTFIKGTTGWVDPANLDARLNNIAISDLLAAMSNLKVDEYVVDKGADLKLYGLDKPRTLTVTTQMGQSRTILLGNMSESKRVYAKLPDPTRTDVFLLSEEDTRRIDRDRLSLGLAPPMKK